MIKITLIMMLSNSIMCLLFSDDSVSSSVPLPLSTSLGNGSFLELKLR